MDTKKTENSEAAAEEAKKRTYIPQTDVPNTTLDDALRVPRAVMENYAGKAATPLQVASALKITPSSGTFRNLCEASIAYGLTAGGYNAKEITVEPLSKRILAPLEEGDDLVAKREAALKPRILGEFIPRYENSPLPRHDIALNVLVEMGVPRERTESVYTLILDTAQVVGLIREIKNKQYIDLSRMHAATKLEGMTAAGQAEELPPSLPALKEREATPIHKELGQGIFRCAWQE